MITTNVFRRVFWLRWKDSSGTLFTIDIDGKQYLVTARHVVNGIRSGDEIHIYHDDKWKGLTVNVVGFGQNKSDIAVLSCSIQLSPIHPLPAGMGGIYLGQDVYFLGFPYGISTRAVEINQDYPLPFVKKAIVSLIPKKPRGILMLDGHNNPGFSGGPVVFKLNQGPDFHVAAVISGYRAEQAGVLNKEGEETVYSVNYNTGIIYAWNISYALDEVQKNPIGFELKTE